MALLSKTDLDKVISIAKQYQLDDSSCTPAQQAARNEVYLDGLVRRPDRMVECGVIAEEFLSLVTRKEVFFLPDEEFTSMDALIAGFEAINCQGGKVTHMVLGAKAQVKLVSLKWGGVDQFFDPVTQLERIQRGYMGVFFGAHVLTDAFLHPMLRFAKNGCALYVVEN